MAETMDSLEMDEAVIDRASRMPEGGEHSLNDLVETTQAVIVDQETESQVPQVEVGVCSTEKDSFVSSKQLKVEEITCATERKLPVEASTGVCAGGDEENNTNVVKPHITTTYQFVGGSLRSSSATESSRSSPSHDGSSMSQSSAANDNSMSGRPRSSSLESRKSTRSKSGSGLRRGKWSIEEEDYVRVVIQDFNSGFLDAPAGTTLRTYLSEKLQCDPMRITKKFTGDSCIGKRVFHPAVRNPSNAVAIDSAQAELEQLEIRWRKRLEMQQRESAKKAAATAAAVANGSRSSQENAVTRTATWLDRAESVLKGDSSSNDGKASDLESQMQEVEKLIHEGPIIQESSAELPDILRDAQERACTNSPDPEPVDKRLRTANQDAEALVGFLRSVRASEATGGC